MASRLLSKEEKKDDAPKPVKKPIINENKDKNKRKNKNIKEKEKKQKKNNKEDIEKKSTKKEKRKKKKGKKKEEEEEEKEKIIYLPLKDEYKIIDEYWVAEPYAKVVIAEIPELGNQKVYFAQEVPLTPAERKAVDKLIDILSVELEPPESFEVDIRRHVIEEARRLAEKYKKSIRGISDESWGKILYYIERDLLGYGPIEVLMRDYRLEDISCDGVDRAIHVWHRDYESIPTNIVFHDRDYLREFIIKLAHMSGKHISAAFPIVDAMLPGRHRLAATYGEEVSPRGSTFTIRKFRERPFSIVDLIRMGNIDSWTAAYLWFLIENKMTLMVIGATAAGKTTLLNAIANFFKPGFKIVTIEETPELNLPHENWVQLVSRESYGLGETKAGEITLYDLVKVSLRYRPDYIIVGEVRGEEAFVLFQAMSTGHGGMSTMHADSLQRAIQRLTSPPMNVSPAYIPSLNIALLTERTILPTGKFARRVRYVWEVEDYGKYREIVRWDPAKDVHMIYGESYHVEYLAKRLGKTPREIYEEIERRRIFLEWMKFKGISETKDVFININRYYVNPKESFAEAYEELKRNNVLPPPPKRASGKPETRVTLEPKRPVPIPAAAPIKAQSIQSRSAIPRIRTQSVNVKTRPLQSSGESKGTRSGVVGIDLSPEERAVIKAIFTLGDEADHVAVQELSGLNRRTFSMVVKRLAEKKLLIPTIIYLDGRPHMGYKLTAKGLEIAKKIAG